MMATPWAVGLLVAGKQTPLPLKDVTVKAQLSGYLVGLDSTLKYCNEESDPLEVVFRFPIDASFAVVGLEAVIAGRKIRAEIQGKEMAHQRYDDALASGFSAALAEEKSGDIFCISLGNLPPKTEAELHLKLVGELPVDAEGAVRFTLPSVLKPRYTPVGSTDPLATAEGEAAQVSHASAPGVFSFALEILHSDDITSVTSPTHAITCEAKDHGIQLVSLSDSKPLDEDLVILILHNSPHEPKAFAEKGDGKSDPSSLMGSPAVMLSFFPKFDSPKAACEFIFLVDRSSSMRGPYIKSARETLVLFLKSIPPGCSFNIIGFGRHYKTLFPSSVPYDQQNLDIAMKHVEEMDADQSGTELLRPLSYIFEQPLLPGLPHQVFELTDGAVNKTHHCIEKVERNVQHARVFTFGIGSRASTDLVRKLARAGNGMAEFVHDGERMQPKVIKSLKQALQPSLTDLQVTFKVPDAYKVLQAPSKPPLLFNGEKVVVYGILKCDTPQVQPATCTAVLTGKMLDKAVEFSLPFDLPGEDCPFSIPTVHHLAAKKMIDDWQHGYGEEPQLSESVKKEAIVKLSIESGVVSTRTAYIAVDELLDKPIGVAIKCWDILALSAKPIIQHKRGNDAESQSVRKYRKCGTAMPVAYGSSHRKTLATSAARRSAPVLSLSRSRRRSRSRSPRVCCRRRSRSRSPRVWDRLVASYQSSALSSRGEGTSPLVQLISLQQAEGAWNLDASLAEVLSKSLQELESACPSGCETVWATALALVLLETKYTAQRNEWELIAMKAERWLAGQTLPTSIPALKEAALMYICTSSFESLFF